MNYICNVFFTLTAATLEQNSQQQKPRTVSRNTFAFGEFIYHFVKLMALLFLYIFLSSGSILCCQQPTPGDGTRADLPQGWERKLQMYICQRYDKYNYYNPFYKSLRTLIVPFCCSSGTESIPTSASRDQSCQVTFILVAGAVFYMTWLGVIIALSCFSPLSAQISWSPTDLPVTPEEVVSS